MSSSYNNTISSSSTQSFPLLAIGANNFNREETAMTMNQRPNSISPPPRRLRNKPGNPSPDAEVIALTPEEIMATNRFQCEVCKKRFQREQNLQLHRRGHNLPFNLKQKSDEEVRRKVYVCPEPTCVYHDPSRALGDLTGIKKHYYRKHGEKKFKCEKCDKCYAVESDCKAHSKICGTKEYRCVCDTKFSRPIRIFESAFLASQKWMRRNLNSSACGPNVTFLKNTTPSFLSKGTSEQTTALPLRFFEGESPETPDWPIGFIGAAEGFIGAAEETASFLVGFLERRSLETEFLLLEFIS
ncbi:hypothetical protein F2Q68_00013403 [Brassica cretica]|uniref:C2H2-type domain-containing protein n=2 Tax=Brassica cretica TaxID=69181 RepID=A0A8S9HJ59_BRACR|nr:hypothetical protein F2Q68_00013403 [Brassica cretica]